MIFLRHNWFLYHINPILCSFSFHFDIGWTLGCHFYPPQYKVWHLLLSFAANSLDPDLDVSGPILTYLEHVTTVSGQLHPDEGQNGLTSAARNGRASGRQLDLADPPTPSSASTRASSTAYLYSSSSRRWSYSGRANFLWKRDFRSEVFVDCFLFWLDTVEMVRVAGDPLVFYSAWVFAIYILAFLSTLRVIIMPHSPLFSAAGVALQDLPFFILRVALIAVFGFVTPVLYLLKNLLVSLSFIYFTFLTELRIFSRQSMFWGEVAKSVVDEGACCIVDGWTVGILV